MLGGLLGVLILPHIPQKLFDVLALTLAGVAAVRLVGLWSRAAAVHCQAVRDGLPC
jgi:hypothetical protein